MPLQPDLINGAFECLAALMVLNHCRVLAAHQAVSGVSIASVAFFTLWGGWNLYYYPALGQPLSFAGGVVVVLANSLYVAMLVHYSRRPFNDQGNGPRQAQLAEGPR